MTNLPKDSVNELATRPGPALRCPMAFIVAVGYLEQMLVVAQQSMYLAGKKDHDSADGKFFQLYYDSGGTVNMFPLQGQACAAVDHRDCQREVHRGVRPGRCDAGARIAVRARKGEGVRQTGIGIPLAPVSAATMVASTPSKLNRDCGRPNIRLVSSRGVCCRCHTAAAQSFSRRRVRRPSAPLSLNLKTELHSRRSRFPTRGELGNALSHPRPRTLRGPFSSTPASQAGFAHPQRSGHRSAANSSTMSCVPGTSMYYEYL